MGEPARKMDHQADAKPQVEDPLKTTSDVPGIGGVVEGLMRKYRMGVMVAMLAPIGFLYAFCIGASMTPGVFIVLNIWNLTQDLPIWPQAICLGLSLGPAFILFALTLIFVVPLVNFLLPFRVKPSRGTWFSLVNIPWYYHNALTYLVRYTVLDFMTPTPLNLMFFRMMGMKIGKGTMINTSNISDPGLITLGDHVTIGGSVTLFAHYGMKGYLIVSRTHIDDNTTIGLRASIFGDVVIGKRCMIPAGTVLMPKTRIPDKEAA